MKKNVWIIVTCLLLMIGMAAAERDTAYASSGTKTTIATPSRVKKLKAGKKTPTSITLKWGRVSKATGYQIYRYNAKTKKWKKIKTTKATSFKVGKLASGKKYKFKVRAYRKSDGKVKTGRFSKTFSVKTNRSCKSTDHLWDANVKYTYKKVWVEDEPEWDEPVHECHYICNKCGKDLTAMYEENPSLYPNGEGEAVCCHFVVDGCAGSYSSVPVKIISYKHHKAEGHYDKEINGVIITGYHCVKCGASCRRPKDGHVVGLY